MPTDAIFCVGIGGRTPAPEAKLDATEDDMRLADMDAAAAEFVSASKIVASPDDGRPACVEGGRLNVPEFIAISAIWKEFRRLDGGG